MNNEDLTEKLCLHIIRNSNPINEEVYERTLYGGPLQFIKDSANTGKSGAEALMLDILGVRDSKKLKLDKIKAYIVKTLLSKVKKMDVNTKEDFSFFLYMVVM